MTSRHHVVPKRLDELLERFPHYLDLFESRNPFSRSGQMERHVRTIRLRRQAPGTTAAIMNPEFTSTLHSTLEAWNMNNRGAKLRPLPEFRARLVEGAEAVAALDGLSLEGCADVTSLANEIWSVISHLELADNKSQLVVGTKALHHLLPELVPPMDRAYTRVFFRWYGQQFQYGQPKFLEEAYSHLVPVAKEAQLDRYVTGKGWRTSTTKLLDNAIVAYCLEKNLSLA